MSTYFTEIKKSVSFIFVKVKDPATNQENLLPNGTGFFVGFVNEIDPTLSNVYFVTAKHVLKDETGNYFDEVTLRLNKLDGTSDWIPIPLKDITIFEHPDADVDIALFPFLPDEKVYDYRWIPNNLISTEEIMKEHDIAEGDEVFFAGLFTSYVGQKKNHPILRFGKVALIPDEKIEWKEDGKPVKLMDLYLLECQSFGGNSGSPVFFSLSALRNPGQIRLGGPVIFLAGVMTGSYLHGNKVLITQAVPNLVSLQNVGIAAVTPSAKLHDILSSEQAMRQRALSLKKPADGAHSPAVSPKD